MSTELLQRPDVSPEGQPLHQEQPPEEDLRPPEQGEQPSDRSTPEALGELSLESFMRQEEIDPGPAQELARGRVETALQSAERYGSFTPAVASAIAHHNDPSVEVIHPTIEDVKRSSGLVGFISGTLNFFLPGLGDKFDRFVVGKAEQKVVRAAQRVTRVIETVGSVADPKERFIQDITHVREAIMNGEKPPQDSLPQLAKRLAQSRTSRQDTEQPDKSSEFTFLGRLVDLTGPSTYYRLTSRKRTLRAFAPEIMQGIEQFLSKQGVATEETEEIPYYKSLTRRLVERVAPRKVQRLPDKVEAMLTSIYGVLPKDGQRFKDGIYGLCKNIEERSRAGEDGRTLTKKLLKEARELLG